MFSYYIWKESRMQMANVGEHSRLAEGTKGVANQYLEKFNAD